jgi:hypothetical protein
MAHKSRQEVYLFAELASVLYPVEVRHHFKLPDLARSVGKVDIAIMISSTIVAVEFDGSYWHAPRLEADKRKSDLIRDAGHHLIRVREQPLLPLHPDDVSTPTEAPPYLTASSVLTRMTERGWIQGVTTDRAEIYMANRQPIGETKAQAMLSDITHRDLGEDSLEATHPEIAVEWDSTLNGELTPRHIRADSAKMVVWVCPAGDRYEQSPNSRTRGRNCPYCANKKANSRNCLATVHPYLLDDWDYESNTIKPQNVTSGSHTRVYWRCRTCGHRWATALKNRTRKKNPSGCPLCARKRNLSTL